MLRRLLPATAAVTLLLAGVTGCAAQPASSGADCESLLQPGPLSDSVTVLGEFGTVPEVSVPSGFEARSAQRTIVHEAEDREDLAVEGTLASANVAFFDAETNQEIYESAAFSGDAPSEFFMVSEQFPSTLSEALRCSAPGDRIVLAMSPQESMQLQQQFGGTVGASAVAVIDLVDTSPLVAEGESKGLPNGYPAVVTDENGQPGVVLPPREAPEGTSSASRIVGDGAVVTADDNVVAQTLSVPWNGDRRKVVNSWDKGVEGIAALGSETQTQASYRAELTGKTVGSQVVIIENVDGEARVVVVDILGVV